MTNFEVGFDAMRLDEYEKALYEKEGKELCTYLTKGTAKYKKDFFNLLKKVLLAEEEEMPYENRIILIRYFISISEFRN